jgi:type IV pilus assembly protein PilA
MSERARKQDGFTFVEILIVIVIVGALAAIALPVFLKQRDSANDADAKAAARSLVSHVESCQTESEDYGACDSSSELGKTGLKFGGSAGDVEVVDATRTSYVAVGHSNTGNAFRIERSAGVLDHDCTTRGRAGCPGDGRW